MFGFVSIENESMSVWQIKAFCVSDEKWWPWKQMAMVNDEIVGQAWLFSISEDVWVHAQQICYGIEEQTGQG